MGCGYSAASAGGSTEMKVRPLKPLRKRHLAGLGGEDRVVAAEIHAGARPELGAALADQDVAPATTASPPYFFTPSRRPALSRPLRDEPPAFLCAISLASFRSRPRARAPPRRRPGTSAFALAAFLPPAMNVDDPHPGQVLAMAALALRGVLAPALDEGDDLRPQHLLQHLGLDARARHEGRAHRHRVAAHHQDLVELHGRPGFRHELLHRQHVVGGDLVLLAAGLQHREHPRSSFFYPASCGPGPAGVSRG